MKKSRTLKLQTLIDLGACKDQTDLFRRTFGTSVRVTEALCIRVADKFDWVWAASHLLSPQALAEYGRVRAAALAEYKRVTAPALAEYKRVRAAASAEYGRVNAAAWAEYGRVTAPAWAEYGRVTAPAWAEYGRVNAAAFARGYLS